VVEPPLTVVELVVVVDAGVPDEAGDVSVVVVLLAVTGRSLFDELEGDELDVDLWDDAQPAARMLKATTANNEDDFISFFYT
jgi:hypothetical protein